MKILRTNRKGFTLLEILISSIILALVMTGLANLFVAGKKYILHSRSRIQAVELGRLFLSPLQMDVDQSKWGSNCLSAGINCQGPQTVDNIVYTPTYIISNAFPISTLHKVKVTIKWDEPSS